MGISSISSKKAQANSILVANTLAFTVCFAVWVMFSAIGIPIKELLQLSETEFGVLIATPILIGAILHLPAGMLTDKFGGRRVFIWLMLFTIAPLWLVGEATEYWQFLVLGLFIGVAGASFPIGIAYTSKWFDSEHQGLAMGIFGVGNVGAALTRLVAPLLLVAFGWQAVPQFFAAAMLVAVIGYWLFTYENIANRTTGNITIKKQLSALNDPNLWKYMQYYGLMFGGFMALSLWMTKYYLSEYGFDLQTAALLATVFILPSGIVRALGGWFSDKYGAYRITWWALWISFGCLLVLSYPQTTLVIKTTGTPIMLDLSMNVWVFTMFLFVLGIAWGFGKAAVFKFLADDYPDNIGVVSGIVGFAGGMGGFILPILFGVLLDYTRIQSVIFMVLLGSTIISLVWMNATTVKLKPKNRFRSKHLDKFLPKI